MTQRVTPTHTIQTEAPQVSSSSIGVKGRTIVPQAVRRALKVGEGDVILYLETPEGILLTTRQALIDRLTGAFARDDGFDLTRELVEDRRAEASRERDAE